MGRATCFSQQLLKETHFPCWICGYWMDPICFTCCMQTYSWHKCTLTLLSVPPQPGFGWFWRHWAQLSGSSWWPHQDFLSLSALDPGCQDPKSCLRNLCTHCTGQVLSFVPSPEELLLSHYQMSQLPWETFISSLQISLLQNTLLL